jgi:hypothetical protein
MPKSAVAVAVSIIVLLASADMATAQQKKKKPTYDEAWKICQAEVNKVSSDQHSARMARGSACMKSLGHMI